MTHWVNVHIDRGKVWYSQGHTTREKAIYGAEHRKPLYRIKVTMKEPK
jgi:hypothetical protein